MLLLNTNQLNIHCSCCSCKFCKLNQNILYMHSPRIKNAKIRKLKNVFCMPYYCICNSFHLCIFFIVMQTNKSNKVIAVSHSTVVNETITNTSSFLNSVYTIIKKLFHYSYTFLRLVFKKAEKIQKYQSVCFETYLAI